MKNFFDKYSIWLTTIVGISLLVYFIFQWSSTTVLQRLVGALYIGIMLHEWEEMLFGFVEMHKKI
jgi:hypothetical protein